MIPAQPGLGAHACGVLSGADVPVSDHRDVQRLDHRSDLLPAGPAAVHVGSRPRVEGEHACPASLAAQGDLHRHAQLLAVAAPDLHRHRNGHRGRYRPDDVLNQVQVPQAPRPAVPLDHLLDRAAEVDVEEVGTVHVVHERRRLRHGSRIGAEDLDPDGDALLAEAEVVVRAPVVPANPLGGDELGDHDVGPVTAAEPPERGLAHARLGREEERRVAAGEEVRSVLWHEPSNIPWRQICFNRRTLPGAAGSFDTPWSPGYIGGLHGSP
jgi:hypothetical protein